MHLPAVLGSKKSGSLDPMFPLRLDFLSFRGRSSIYRSVRHDFPCPTPRPKPALNHPTTPNARWRCDSLGQVPRGRVSDAPQQMYCRRSVQLSIWFSGRDGVAQARAHRLRRRRRGHRASRALPTEPSSTVRGQTRPPERGRLGAHRHQHPQGDRDGWPTSEGRPNLEVVTAQRRTSSPRTMSGSIDEARSPIYRSCLLPPRNGVLVARTEDDVGRIFLHKGSSTTPRSTIPMSSAHQVHLPHAHLAKGALRFDPAESREFAHPVEATVQEILMESMRQRDELNTLREKLPELGAHLLMNYPLSPKLRDFCCRTISTSFSSRSIPPSSAPSSTRPPRPTSTRRPSCRSSSTKRTCGWPTKHAPLALELTHARGGGWRGRGIVLARRPPADECSLSPC